MGSKAGRELHDLYGAVGDLHRTCYSQAGWQGIKHTLGRIDAIDLTLALKNRNRTSPGEAEWPETRTHIEEDLVKCTTPFRNYLASLDGVE